MTRATLTNITNQIVSSRASNKHKVKELTKALKNKEHLRSLDFGDLSNLIQDVLKLEKSVSRSRYQDVKNDFNNLTRYIRKTGKWHEKKKAYDKVLSLREAMPSELEVATAMFELYAGKHDLYKETWVDLELKEKFGEELAIKAKAHYINKTENRKRRDYRLTKDNIWDFIPNESLPIIKNNTKIEVDSDYVNKVLLPAYPVGPSFSPHNGQRGRLRGMDAVEQWGLRHNPNRDAIDEGRLNELNAKAKKGPSTHYASSRYGRRPVSLKLLEDATMIATSQHRSLYLHIDGAQLYPQKPRVEGFIERVASKLFDTFRI